MSVATRYATKKMSGSNDCKLHSYEWSLFLGGIMVDGHFYYINEQYFIDFPDTRLMQNKEKVKGEVHDRPCYYAFKDSSTQLYWMIPISSQIIKYRKYYNDKVTKYKRCDTIIFGEVLGREKAFLIQNMFPITPQYIKNEYIDSNAGIPVRISRILEKKLREKAKRILALQRKGFHIIFPDVLTIESKLLNNNS